MYCPLAKIGDDMSSGFYFRAQTYNTHTWTAPSKSTDRLSVSSSVRELVSVQPDSGVADP